jgi:hypothetical protein
VGESRVCGGVSLLIDAIHIEKYRVAASRDTQENRYENQGTRVKQRNKTQGIKPKKCEHGILITKPIFQYGFQQVRQKCMND